MSQPQAAELPPQEIIRAKRDGAELPAADIARFIAGLVDGRVADSQAAAFAMAVFFRGMTLGERVALTQAMARSGVLLDWSAEGLDGPTLDKHSTGGIGDATSLVIAPLVAACGGYVPMISGRGLGHTGGTLDKLDAIPGYRAQPDLDVFRRVVREVGCAVIGQTGDLAPADRRLYAIRDVTATVESIPLITASILSKKLAAGLDALVLDVKSGNGAFMASARDASALTKSLVEVANGAGMPTTALITDMNEPLASAAGNAVEVANAVDFLTGKTRDRRLLEVTLALAAEMLASAGVADDRKQARARAKAALDGGKAAEIFGRMVADLGGPADFIDNMQAYLPNAPVVREIAASAAGIVAEIATRDIGLAVVAMGGGRTRPQDKVDPAVGFTALAPLGAKLSKGDALAVVHARSETQAQEAEDAVRAAYRLSNSGAASGPAVKRRIGRP